MKKWPLILGSSALALSLVTNLVLIRQCQDAKRNSDTPYEFLLTFNRLKDGGWTPAMTDLSKIAEYSETVRPGLIVEGQVGPAAIVKPVQVADSEFIGMEIRQEMFRFEYTTVPTDDDSIAFYIRFLSNDDVLPHLRVFGESGASANTTIK